MKWTLKEPVSGNIVRIQIGNIYHYGIYVSDDEIIQFGLPPINMKSLLKEDIKVLSTDINTFLCGKFLEVGELSLLEKLKARKNNEVIKYARSKIGVGGYNILYNNCEHFVNECVFNEHKCSQVDSARSFVQQIPRSNVFLYKIPNDVEIKKVNNQSRQEEIDKCSNESVKRQKYLAWVLLKYALKHTYNIDIDNDDIHRNEYSKYVSSKYNLSITHSTNYVCVALSNYKIGIDIENISRVDFSDKFIDRVATKEEHDRLNNEIDLAILWTKKESIFKMEDKECFNPLNINTLSYKTLSYLIDEDSILSIACENLDNIDLFNVLDIDKEIIEKIKKEVI